MKRFIFEEEHEMFRDSVRSFMQNEIGPQAEKWHEQGIVDREAFLKAGEMGLLLMWADEKYGAAGVQDFRYEQILIEENAHYGDPGFFMTLHSRLVGPYIGNFGTEEQKSRWQLLYPSLAPAAMSRVFGLELKTRGTIICSMVRKPLSPTASTQT